MCLDRGDDKSKFLAQAGFTSDKPLALEAAIRSSVAATEARPDGSNVYGDFYRVDGELVGPTGMPLAVSLIWIRWKLDSSFHFVTLKPKK